MAASLAFVAYAEHLHALGKLLVAAEVLMARGPDHPRHDRGVPVLPEPPRPAGQVRRGQERRRPHLQLPDHALYRSADSGVSSGCIWPPFPTISSIRPPGTSFKSPSPSFRIRSTWSFISSGVLVVALSCPAWSLERLSDGGGQPSQVHALYPEAERSLRRDRGARLRLVAVCHSVLR